MIVDESIEPRDATTTPVQQASRTTSRLLTALSVAVLVPLLLIPCFPQYVYHWDEAQLALGLERFDLEVHQPHPPGYYLFILLGRLLALLIDAPEDALRSVAVLAAAAAAALIGAAISSELRSGARAGLAAATVGFVVLSPVVFFFSVSALTYTVEAACWLALLLAMAHRPAARGLLVMGIGIGLSSGLRPTLLIWGLTALVLTWLLSRSWPGVRALGYLVAGLLVGLLAWVVPMLVEAGGVAAYLAAGRPLMLGNIWAKSIGHVGLGVVFRERLPLMMRDVALALGPLLLLPLAGLLLRFRSRYRARLARWDLLLVGALIAFVFYATLIYDSQGYILACALPLAAYGFLTLAELLRDASRPLRVAGVLTAAALSAALALVPGGHLTASSRYRELVERDATVGARLEAVRQSAPPETTVLVTSLEYWSWGFRHVMFHLPDYTVLQLVPDPFVGGTASDRPYLTARAHRTWLSGPETLDVRSLAESPSAVTTVLYMVPHDVPQFVDGSCLPLLRPVSTGQSENLGALTAGAGLRVLISKGRLLCIRTAD